MGRPESRRGAYARPSRRNFGASLHDLIDAHESLPRLTRLRLGSLTALITWSLLLGPLVDWRQERLTEQMERLAKTLIDDLDREDRHHDPPDRPGREANGGGRRAEDLRDLRTG